MCIDELEDWRKGQKSTDKPSGTVCRHCGDPVSSWHLPNGKNHDHVAEPAPTEQRRQNIRSPQTDAERIYAESEAAKFPVAASPVEGPYTDTHLIVRGSSVDLIERCAAFIRQCGDFEGILDSAEDKKSLAKLHDLTKRAMQIIARESK